MRAIFYGTPDIAVPALNALNAVADVVGVVCQPDRPAGRGMKLRAPPVKVRAQALNLEVQQPTRIKSGDFPEWIRQRRADIALVIAYGRILPPSLLVAPRLGSVNLHASLLPKHRGAAPIHWSIVHGDEHTGISLMQMDEGCDTGPVFSRHPIAIEPNETTGALHDRLATLAAEVVRQDLPRVVAGELSSVPQNATRATLAPMLSKRDGLVDWSLPAKKVHDHARGMTPWPGAYSYLEGKRVKLIATRLSDTPTTAPPATIVSVDSLGAQIACGRGSITLLQAQFEGKKALSAADLARGRTIAPLMRFSSK